MGEFGFKYAHQGIAVENMEESIAWYEKIFNAKVISDELSSEFGAPLNCRVVHMVTEDIHFELFKYLGSDMVKVADIDRNSVTTLRNCGNKHVCYEVNIPKFVFEKLVPNNVWIDHGPEKHGAVRSLIHEEKTKETPYESLYRHNLYCCSTFRDLFCHRLSMA